VAQEQAVGGEDPDIAVGDEGEHSGALVTAAEGDVVEAASVAEVTLPALTLSWRIRQ
jgi:hypothetical protein